MPYCSNAFCSSPSSPGRPWRAIKTKPKRPDKSSSANGSGLNRYPDPAYRAVIWRHCSLMPSTTGCTAKCAIFSRMSSALSFSNRFTGICHNDQSPSLPLRNTGTGSYTAEEASFSKILRPLSTDMCLSAEYPPNTTATRVFCCSVRCFSRISLSNCANNSR